MGTTAEKLYKIIDSKEEIKQALIAKGINITDETTFAEYAEKINEITNGGAITDEEALLFIKDVAEGKRKIAKAVRNKYETITEEESGITEYSTFEEMSNKISQIPIEVPLGSAMEQNGGVLPFYDVYNEALKAMKNFAGYGFNGCCAFELDKWDYDSDHKVTLSGADAYYTSDGTFIKDNIIYKNGNQIGELDNSIYQFQDVNAENTNRFVVYFFTNERYQVPKTLHATSCLNLWCIKGTPLINFNADFTQLNSINVYDGELEAKSNSDLNLTSLSALQKINFYQIKSIYSAYNILNNLQALRFINLPNLEIIGIDGSNIVNNTAIIKIKLDKLEKIENITTFITACQKLKEINLPNLSKLSIKLSFINNLPLIKRVLLPKLKTMSFDSYTTFFSSTNGEIEEFDISNLETFTRGDSTNAIVNSVTINEISLPKAYNIASIITGNAKVSNIYLGSGIKDNIAGNIRIASQTNTYLTNLTVAEGFKAKLNLTGCNGLSREVLVDILNNLADLTGETSLNLIMGSTLLGKLTDADKAIATQKNWTLS